MHSLSWRYVEVPSDVATIITGDQKPTGLAEDIIKIATALDEDADRVQDLRGLFADFKELNEKRNQCVHWMWSPPRQWKRRGAAQPKMNQSKMNIIPVALPPTAEQHRVIAKVDELISLCDRLEASLVAADRTRLRPPEALAARSAACRYVRAEPRARTRGSRIIRATPRSAANLLAFPPKRLFPDRKFRCSS
jgi:hypothetical protein